MKCFYCDKEIEDNQLVLIALDRPYINLYVHSNGCFSQIEGMGTNNYLQENVEKIYAQYTASLNLPKGKKK